MSAPASSSPVALLHLSLHQPDEAGVCFFFFRGQRFRLHPSDITVDGAEARKSDPSLPPKVILGACVDPLDQALLIQEGMIGTQCTGSVVVTLVVVAKVRLPNGGDVLVHVQLLA